VGLTVVLLIGGLLGGCGSASKPASAPVVRVSLTAPVDGATVAVPNIEVIGSIDPANAVVRVFGSRVKVVNGAFKQHLLLRNGLTRIRISARARGFTGTTTWVRVRFRPRRARSLRSFEGSSAIGAESARVSVNNPAEEAGFINACSSGGAGAAVCGCMWKQLVATGFDTEAQWATVAESWRHSFLSNGTITYPPQLRRAIISCVGQLRGG
jgi:hypothetical protein